jgi:hypothetical protein
MPNFKASPIYRSLFFILPPLVSRWPYLMQIPNVARSCWAWVRRLECSPKVLPGWPDSIDSVEGKTPFKNIGTLQVTVALHYICLGPFQQSQQCIYGLGFVTLLMLLSCLSAVFSFGLSSSTGRRGPEIHSLRISDDTHTFSLHSELVGGTNENFKRGCCLDWPFVARDAEDTGLRPEGFIFGLPTWMTSRSFKEMRKFLDGETTRR